MERARDTPRNEAAERERENEANNWVDDKLLSEKTIVHTLAFTEWFLSSIERQ